MKTTNKILSLTLVALPLAGFVLAADISPKPAAAGPSSVARGKYLVSFGDCNACHTPLKMGPNGPEPDMTKFLAGHPADTKLPPADLKPGPWFAATAGMTAWTGPWGVSYAANLTPDVGTGLGIWTEDMFIQAMRTGKHMGHGRPILPPMPWQASAGLSDDDLKAIYAYLRTVPAITNAVPQPLGPDGKPAIAE